jgi:hypothetical protein
MVLHVDDSNSTANVAIIRHVLVFFLLQFFELSKAHVTAKQGVVSEHQKLKRQCHRFLVRDTSSSNLSDSCTLFHTNNPSALQGPALSRKSVFRQQ